MRVLSVGNMYPPHDLRGGYEATWRSSVLHLRDHGHEVRVLTSDYRAPDLDASSELDDDVHRELRWYWRDHAFPRLRLRERIAIERHNAAVLAQHLDALRPDAVAWWGMGGMSLALIERVRRAGIPSVGIVGDEWLRWGPRVDGWLRPFNGRRRLARAAERIARLPAMVDFDAAGTWLFNSETTLARSLGRGRGLPRSAVAHPGIDDELFHPAPERPWGWRLLYLGRLDERKGIHVAVDALALLPAEATLTVQGWEDESYEARVREQVARQGLGDRVVFSREPRERLREVYARADLLVFPVQWEEPWGLVPLEAMAVGRPVVASGTGGSREYLRHEHNCLLYAPRESAAALADAVRRLGGDEGLRGSLRRHGAETAARYTERAYNDAIEHALEAVARPAATE